MLRGHLRAGERSWTRPVLGWSAGLVGALVLVAGLDAAGVPTFTLLSDPVQAGGDSPFRGSLSSIALLLWGVSGGVLVLAGSLRRSNRSGFLVATGLLLFALGVDDAALLHEEAADRLLGLPDIAVYSVYAVVGIAWLLRFVRHILRSDLFSLGAACVGFGSSVMIDAFHWLPGRSAFEETLKYYGLVAICAWAVRLSRAELVDREDSGDREPALVAS